MRGFRRREQERQTQIRSKLLQLSTEIRRGRTGQRRARALLRDLQALCGTNNGIADAWKELIDQAIRNRRHSRVLKQFTSLVDLMAFICKAEWPPVAKKAKRRPKAARDEPGLDVASLSDEALEAAIRAYEDQHGRGRQGGW